MRYWNLMMKLRGLCNMAYVRKTRDFWVVEGLYYGVWEYLCGAYTKKEAYDDLKAYRENEGGCYRVRKTRERIDDRTGV